MNKVNVGNPVEREAMRYLEDQAYSALMGYKEPVRSAEIIGSIEKDKYSAKLMRHVLAASPRFAQVDRRWDLEVRYEDKQRPVERVLREIIAQAGQPLSAQQIADELSGVYERPADYFEALVSRMISDETKYFRTSDDLYGLRDWLLEVTSDLEDDIIFDNALDEEEIRNLEGPASKANWQAKDIGSAVNKFIEAAKTPVSNKMVGFFRWRAVGEAFDPEGDFSELYKTARVVWLSDGRWANKHMVEEYDRLLVELADHLAEEVIEEATPSVVENAEAAEDVAPALSLTVSDRDLEEIVQIIEPKGEARMPLILETIFEISPRDPVYEVAAEGLADAMRADERFAWVGTDRWRMAASIPENVKSLPAELEIPRLQFESAEGEQLEVELEDEGLEGGLEVEIHNPLVQDVGDCDEITEQDELPPADFARCVVTRHHRQLGTFPLCQIPDTFLPLGPPILQLTLVEGDKRGDIWVNRDTGLIYAMNDWYIEEMPESGAVFNLVKTEKPDEFQFEYEADTDPLTFVAPNRIEELMELAELAQERDLPTYEIIARILSHYRKGIEFVTLFTEVNIVRRTTRRMVASILSSYYAFYQRPKSARWAFDEKKEDQGFKKAKKKYVRKSEE